ncbi:MAG: DUF3810 family protein [Vicinamibacterales bacterium]|nr:hypothetical protein [Acidobacteriota bacterium]MDP6372830.1 DUF3810 family protein [Vicinamibacterales bacterium]MDP6609740.1 DUF3810 family protein [Vicinamibacterales bacterium]
MTNRDGAVRAPARPTRSRWRLVILMAALVAAVAPTSGACVERMYSRGFYPGIQRALTSLSNLAPVALFDLLLLGAGIGLAARWVVVLRRPTTVRRVQVVFGLVRDSAVVLAAGYLAFLLCWGLNYRREPLRAKLDFDQARITAASLEALAHASVNALNRLHGPAQRQSWPALDAVPAQLVDPFRQAQARLPAGADALPARPKTTLLGFYFRRAGIDGMTDPFLLETLVNAEVLPFERPFVIAHEWAHLAGYADEAEASFVAWLTCQSGDAATRYSGWLFLYPHLVRQLDRDTRRAVAEGLHDGPARDLAAIGGRLARASPVVRRQANRVYDRYLRANRVSSGIASYGGVVDLVLGARAGPPD